MYSPSAGTAVCPECDAGKYSAEAGVSERLECLVGEFLELPRPVDCSTCHQGHYSDFTGATACIDCVQGRCYPIIGAYASMHVQRESRVPLWGLPTQATVKHAIQALTVAQLRQNARLVHLALSALGVLLYAPSAVLGVSLPAQVLLSAMLAHKVSTVLQAPQVTIAFYVIWESTIRQRMLHLVRFVSLGSSQDLAVPQHALFVCQVHTGPRIRLKRRAFHAWRALSVSRRCRQCDYM